MSNTASSNGPGTGSSPTTTSPRNGRGIRPSRARIRTERIALRAARMSGSLGREWNGSRSGERLRETSQHHEVGMQRDLLDSAHAQGCESELVLEPTELCFTAERPR